MFLKSEGWDKRLVVIVQGDPTDEMLIRDVYGNLIRLSPVQARDLLPELQKFIDET